MKHTEIIEKIKKGETLKMQFMIRKIHYFISDTRITELQFRKAKESFKEGFTIKTVLGGFTEHFYTLK
jgi:hypothetical protein